MGGSQGLKPFADAGLGADMTVLGGLSINNINLNGSGGSEGGTVAIATAANIGGTRAGEAESDDAFASGPWIEQLLLKTLPSLQRPGPGYAGAIADSRTDFGDIGPKTLSYSNEMQSVNSVRGASMEAKPLMPVLSPLVQYTNLFSGFAPGSTGSGGAGGSGPAADATLKKLVGRRSVLDFSVDELNHVKQLAPSGARSKLSIHTDAVLATETSVVNAINAGYPPTGGGGATGTGGTGASDPFCPPPARSRRRLPTWSAWPIRSTATGTPTATRSRDKTTRPSTRRWARPISTC